MNTYEKIIVVFFTFFVALHVHAYVGAVSTATAGSGRATFDMTEAPTANPAAISYLRGYFFNTGYGTLDKGNQFYLSLTDNLPDTVMPSTIQYAQSNQKTATLQDWSAQTIKFGVGNSLSDRLALGIGINHQIDTVGAIKYTQTNMMMGTLFNLNSELTMALVFENLLDPDQGTPKTYRLAPSTAVGLSYNYKRFVRLRFDIETPQSSNSFNQPGYATAIETYWNRWVILRLSARKEMETKKDQYGGGLGFVGPKFALHYGYIHSPQDEKLTRHAVDLAVPIW